ncbi:MAG: RDD family protein [Deltaproteobacteria bacterium]|nr:RDD family protein [Deltaproteobacteria bacterium]MCB9479535.1 RDD family protein [Deltaproteobacteria bacterium]MCB9488435.1 RDD family protein [Deltaproteobacteria bacterium]
MSDPVAFETPENVQVRYEIAGLGTRFVAWVIDSIIVGLAAFVMILAVIAFGSATESGGLYDKILGESEGDPAKLTAYFFALVFVILSFVGFLVFALQELFMNGQTVGKRITGLRVVRDDGFSLAPGAILIRNIFRVLDGIPLAWFAPVFSARSKRFGDMVAGTLVVRDNIEPTQKIRHLLMARPPEEAVFPMDAVKLKKIAPDELELVESLLERWEQLTDDAREDLAAKACALAAKRMKIDEPEAARRRVFLEDLLAAALRRRYRPLG